MSIYICDSQYDSTDQRSSTSTQIATSSPVEIACVTELGDVKSFNTSVRRDLGFQGRIGRYIMLTYGDTMFGESDNSEFQGMTCNSVALATSNPCIVYDSILNEEGLPRCFLSPSSIWKEDPSVYALGITNVIETYLDCGAFFFLLNHRPDGCNNLIGAGVAKVRLDFSTDPPTPIARRLNKYMWEGEREPWFGDVCSLRRGDYIYAYGHMKDNPWVYLLRVRWAQIEDVSAYEYWHGVSTGWSRQRLTKENVGESQAVFWQIQQGQVIWSNYHQRYLFIYADNFWSCQILMKTAIVPEGPWSEPTTIFKPKPIQAGGNIYSPVPHPYYDSSGRTLVITFTNHPNCIQAIRVVCELKNYRRID